MAVDTYFTSSMDKLKIEEPWLIPRDWESITSESGTLTLPHSYPTEPQPLFDTSTVLESSLVRLAMNALQGVQSAIVSIEKLSAAFCSDPADRTFHRIPSLWNRAASTHSLGKILKSIGRSGYVVCILRKFVDYFTNLDSYINFEAAEYECTHDGKMRPEDCPSVSLINQAFSVAVSKILEGYICALDLLYASIDLRRSSKRVDVQELSSMPSGVGCLTNKASETTLLEVYLHTRELRNQIEALGYICNLHPVALCFDVYSFEDLMFKQILDFRNFPKGGNLLTYLNTLLQIADPAHRAVLKFLFLRSCEPYCGFIRSWIYKAEISDPYKEFIVEPVDNPPHCSHGKADISVNFMLASIRERDCISVPCFLKGYTVPIVRAGQQLQVVMKLLAVCNYISSRDHSIKDFLPCWSGFSSNHPSHASPLTFNKVNIENMVHSRNSYYKRMQEKVELFLKKLDIRYQQVVLHDPVSLLFDDSRESEPPSVADNRGLDLDIGSADSETSTTYDLASVVDPLDSSEYSSVNSFEEKIEHVELTEHLNCFDAMELKYLSALSFSQNTSINRSAKKSLQSEESCHIEDVSHETCERTDVFDYVMDSCDRTCLSKLSLPLGPRQPKTLNKLDIHSTDSLRDFVWPVGSLLKNPFCSDGNNKEDTHQGVSVQRERNRDTVCFMDGVSDLKKMTATSYVLIDKLSNKAKQLEHETCASSHLSNFQQRSLEQCCNYFSMNPALTKNPFFHSMSKPEWRSSSAHGETFPCFDFSSVGNPCELNGGKLISGKGQVYGCEPSSDSVTSNRNENCGRDNVLINEVKVLYDDSPLHLKSHEQEDNDLTDVSGGSGWESLLGGFGNTATNVVGDQWQSLLTSFDIPLDFIIEKCLLQEIMLQYKYVSKLTIKLLEEGFDLQEHFLALRRYHFMEVADWADIFITLLWHHSHFVTEADQRVSDFQGFLELSIQKSSCHQDGNKDRLFVFMKGQEMMHASTSMIGVRSFDFLGLGYRVDWPVSIVLTPSALKIYADIFSFLIQVKLAAFSLTDVWRTLKELKHLISHCKLHKKEVCHFNTLIKMRHQVNHFVATLQQYVQSQLSHVAWCRFSQALKHKVKDMMDIESVHMDYLMDSLNICFLSEESQFVGSIIGNILQCALDFQSCFTGGNWDIGLHQGDLLGKLSKIDTSKILTIKKGFDKNLKDLHLLYLKSPKHSEFGISRFWENLNYNDYYSDIGNVLGIMLSQFKATNAYC